MRKWAQIVAVLVALALAAPAQVATGGGATGGTAGAGSAQMIYLSTTQTGGTLACPNTTVGTAVTCSVYYTVVSGTSVGLSAIGNPTGTDAGDFSQSNNCGTLPHTFSTGTGCSVTITFTPQAAGTRTAQFQITDSTTNSPYTIQLTGTASAPCQPVASVSPLSLIFPAQPQGTTSSPQNVTYQNTGNCALAFTSISISGVNGADFAQSNNCVSPLAAGAACTLAVTFTPGQASGSETATLAIVDTTGTTNVSLSGTAAAPLAPDTNLNAPVSNSWIRFYTNSTYLGTGQGQQASMAEVTPYDQDGNALLPPSAPIPSSTLQYYVSTTGSNTTGTGTQANPWATIAYADAHIALGATGTLVHVAAGTYNGDFSTSKAGTSAAPVTYVSDTPYGAQLVGDGSNAMTWRVNGDYTYIENFDISGVATDYAGIQFYSNHSRALGNKVHDLPATSCPANGGQGIGDFGGPAALSDDWAVGNLIYNIGPTGGACNTIHGIYWAGTNDITENNIVGRVAARCINTDHYASGQVIANNTVFNCDRGGILLGNSASSFANATIVNNIAINSVWGIECLDATTNTLIENNILSGDTTTIVNTANCPNIVGTITTAPTFVNYQANGTGDYHLATGSAGIDQGATTCAAPPALSPCVPATDFDDNVRPAGSAYDVGAYEYGSSSASTWSFSADSSDSGHPASYAFDDNPATYWLTTSGSLPHWVAANMAATQQMIGAALTVRQDGCDNGWPVTGEADTSPDGSAWVAAFSGNIGYPSGTTFNCPGASTPLPIFLPFLPGAAGFGNQTLNTTSAAQTVTLKNTGSAVLNLTLPAAVSGDFAIASTTCTATLAPASSCTFSVTFTPTAAGLRVGALTLTDNAADSPQVAPLWGYGVSSSGPIAFIQSNTVAPGAGAASLSATYSKAQSAGDLNLVFIGWADTTTTIQAVSDTSGNTYVQAGSLTRTTGLSQAVYYAQNIKAAAAGANAITVSFSASANVPNLRILEYAGIATAGALDTVVSNTGNSTTPTSTTISNTNNDLLVGGSTVQNSITGVGAGWTQRAYVQGDNVQDEFPAATGSYTLTATQNAGNWVTHLAAFKGSASSPPPQSPALQMAFSGGGSGTVVSSPAGINCSWNGALGTTSGTCSANFVSGTVITLTATATSGTFGGFGSPCSTSPCTFTLTQNTVITATFNPSTAAPTLGNQEPITTLSDINGMFNMPLGSNWTSHLAVANSFYPANSDTMIANEFAKGKTGARGGAYMNQYVTAQDQGQAKYYGQASDPVYEFTACARNSGDNIPAAFSAIGFPFHAPSGTQPNNAGASTDYAIRIWDTTSNTIISSYNPHTAFPACPGGGHAGTTADPCPLSDSSFSNTLLGCTKFSFNETTPYGPAGDGWSTAGYYPFNGMVRFQELLQGHIYHMVYLDVNCTSGTPNVFPNSTGYTATVCSSPSTGLPNGSLIALDYTPAQLADMCPASICGVAGAHPLPAWQYPFLEALARYGGYVGDTFGQTSVQGIGPTRQESEAAYLLAGIPTPAPVGFSGFWAWLTPQSNSGCFLVNGGYKCPTPLFENVPAEANNVGGSGTNVFAHMHVLDQCVAIGQAGLSSKNGISACSSPQTYYLHVTILNNGSGSPQVTVNTSGPTLGLINPFICGGGTCSQSYYAYSYVTLTAQAASGGASFSGWSGACAGAGMNLSCTLQVTGSLSATANFGGNSGNSYNSSFASPPAPENPISEGGHWITGFTTGLQWSDVETPAGGGKAWGEEGMNGTTGYADGTAVLTGAWGSSQTAQGTVYTTSPPAAGTPCYPEVELRLDTAIAANSITGYEINYAIDSSGTSGSAYMQIVRWNGAKNNFTTLKNFSGASFGVKNGDTVKATIDASGNITVYKNGTVLGTATDTTYVGTGSPGMGFNYNPGGSCPAGASPTGNNDTYGFSQFTGTAQ